MSEHAEHRVLLSETYVQLLLFSKTLHLLRIFLCADHVLSILHLHHLRFMLRKSLHGKRHDYIKRFCNNVRTMGPYKRRVGSRREKREQRWNDLKTLDSTTSYKKEGLPAKHLFGQRN